MPSSGSGTGTPVSAGGVPPTTIPDAWPNCAVSLARYAEIIQYDSCAFWGVHYSGQEEFACSTFWTEFMRRGVADALAQAQQMIEDIIRYPLCRTWITGTLASPNTSTGNDDARLVDQQAIGGVWAANRNPLVTRWSHVIAAGIRAESVIDDDATVDYTTEPATIGPFTTTITDTTEVVVRFPDSDRIITPSRMTYTGGVLTIYVPRCRLVNPDLLDDITVDVGLEYTDTDNFTTTVDVRRVYNDTSTNAIMVRDHNCDLTCASSGCTQASDTACMVVKDPLHGIVEIHPATYSSGAWSYSTCSSYCYNHVRLNYYAGVPRLTRTVENVIVRLAHSLLPEEPCGCDVVKRMWERDRGAPGAFGVEAAAMRYGSPFGFSDGALFAYNWVTGQMEAGSGGLV